MNENMCNVLEFWHLLGTHQILSIINYLDHGLRKKITAIILYILSPLPNSLQPNPF